MNANMVIASCSAWGIITFLIGYSCGKADKKRRQEQEDGENSCGE